MSQPCFPCFLPDESKDCERQYCDLFTKEKLTISLALAKWMCFKASPFGSIVYICPYKLINMLAMGNLGATESLQLLEGVEPRCPLPSGFIILVNQGC